MSQISPELNEFLESIIERVSDLESIVISDKDGIILTKVQSETSTIQKEEIIKILSSTGATSFEQSSKCGLGKGDKIIIIYEHVVLIQFNALPIVVSLLANVKSNIGLLIQLEHDIISAVEPVRQVVQTIERENAQV